MSIRMPWDTHPNIDDNPGHRDRVSIRLYATTADALVGSPATMLVLHGTDSELILTINAIVTDGWDLLGYFTSEDCQPAFGCRHLVVFHAGHPGPTDLVAALSHLVGIDGSDALPWVKNLGPGRR